jgi:hypothetical protein
MFSSLLALTNTTDINLGKVWYVKTDATGTIVRFFFDDTSYYEITGDTAKAYVLARQAWIPKTTDTLPRFSSLLKVSALLDISMVNVQFIDVQEHAIQFFFSPLHYQEITGQDKDDYVAMRQNHMPKLRDVFQQLGEV